MFTIDSLRAHFEQMAKDARDIGDTKTAEAMEAKAASINQEAVDLANKFDANTSTDRPWYRRAGTWCKIGGGVVAVAGLGFLAYRMFSGGTEAAAEVVTTATETAAETAEAAALR